VDPSENIPIYTTMPFADRADEELVGIVVVIPVRAVGIEEEEPWVFPDERPARNVPCSRRQLR